MGPYYFDTIANTLSPMGGTVDRICYKKTACYKYAHNWKTSLKWLQYFQIMRLILTPRRYSLFLFHFQVEVRASLPPPSYAPVNVNFLKQNKTKQNKKQTKKPKKQSEHFLIESPTKS